MTKRKKIISYEVGESVYLKAQSGESVYLKARYSDGSERELNYLLLRSPEKQKLIYDAINFLKNHVGKVSKLNIMLKNKK